MKKEYLIIGDNNFWYASCIGSLKKAQQQAREIKDKDSDSHYGCALCNREPCCEPETIYIYKAEEIKRIEL